MYNELGIWCIGDKDGCLNFINDLEKFKNNTSFSMDSVLDEQQIPLTYLPPKIGTIKHHKTAIKSIICTKEYILTISIDNEIMLFPKSYIIEKASKYNIELHKEKNSHR